MVIALQISLFFFLTINLFIYLFLAALGLHYCMRAFSLVAASRGYSSLRCAGFSLPWFLLLWSRALGARALVVVACSFSSCGSRVLERRLSSCGTRAQLLHGMWDLPGPGLEPLSPVLAGGFLTTAPPGKSRFANLQRKTANSCQEQFLLSLSACYLYTWHYPCYGYGLPFFFFLFEMK